MHNWLHRWAAESNWICISQAENISEGAITEHANLKIVTMHTNSPNPPLVTLLYSSYLADAFVILWLTLNFKVNNSSEKWACAPRTVGRMAKSNHDKIFQKISALLNDWRIVMFCFDDCLPWLPKYHSWSIKSQKTYCYSQVRVTKAIIKLAKEKQNSVLTQRPWS